MANLGTTTDLKTAINSRVNDNISQDITPTDVRSSIVDTVDTLDALKEAAFLPTFTAVVSGVTKTYRQGSALVAGKQYYFDVAAGVPGSNMYYWTETAAPNGIWTLLVGGVSEAVETTAANSATPQDVPAWSGTTPVLSPLESTSQEAIEALALRYQVGKTLYVDATLGDDDTAIKGRPDKPYETLAAADAAAVSGDLITVRPGTYDERVTLSDINYHFENGAILHYTGTDPGCVIGDNPVQAATCRVTGSGRFRHSGLTNIEDVPFEVGPYNGVVGFMNTSTDVYFEYMTIDGDQQQPVGSGALCLDAGNVTFLCKEYTKSSIYDGLLLGAEVDGSGTVNGRIPLLQTTADADNAIEGSGSKTGYIKIDRIVHGNTEVACINGIPRNMVIECDQIQGGGVRLVGGKLKSAEITLQDTSDDAANEVVSIGAQSGTPGRLVGCRVLQTKAGKPGIRIENDIAELNECIVFAGAAATESIVTTAASAFVSNGSKVFVAIGAGLTVQGSLQLDTGAASAGDVPTANADGTWTWA